MRGRAVFTSLLGALLLAMPGSWAAAQDDDFVELPGLGTTRIDVPRPSSGGPPCTLDLSLAATTVERVRGLRAAGLFADRASLSDEDLAADVEAGIGRDWGGLLAGDPLEELFVAEQDRGRAWWRDLEADVAADGGVYEATLGEWAAISAGAFAPTAVIEAWASETGPVTISFQMDGLTHVLQPDYLEDWIDPRILGPIDDLIAPSGRRFLMVAPFDQTAFVLALTGEEQTALEARGWCFS
jgi:hypothetical protein